MAKRKLIGSEVHDIQGPVDETFYWKLTRQMSEIPVVKLNSCDTFRRCAGKKKKNHVVNSNQNGEQSVSHQFLFRQLDWAHLQAACNLLDSFFSPFSCCCRTIVTKHKRIIIKASRLSWPRRGRETPMTGEQQRLTFTSRGPLFDIVLFLMRSSCPQHQHSAPHRHEKKKRKRKEKKKTT